jgi:hypothetical protein
MHQTSTALGVLRQFGKEPTYPLTDAIQFCDSNRLEAWLEECDLGSPWIEGNRLFFVGQFLAYLRDREQPGAREALELWFRWHDERVDPATGLWGTDAGATVANAMYGGYHQLLVYFHERRPVPLPERLIESTLSVQHPDGGFSIRPGGGACEDADGVDILVNLYKDVPYARPKVRAALRRCLRHLVRLQNPDGGFPYHPDDPFAYASLPGTAVGKGESNVFGTWFRVQTIALISEVLTDVPGLREWRPRFLDSLAMGWHRRWDRVEHPLGPLDRLAEAPFATAASIRALPFQARRLAGRTLRALGLRR